MGKQTLMWLLLIAPWFTLILMTKEDIKRLMPAALFTAISSGIIYQLGLVAGFWYFRDVAFPVVMYGPLPVAAIWVLKFTYGRYWLYTITNAIFDIGFAFVIFPWFKRIGIIGVGPWTGIIVYVINFVHAALIYGYHKWQMGGLKKFI